MFSSKKIYTECFEEYILSDEKISQLQDNLLKMFLDVKRIFDKYNIDYMMSGGSLLGTIRHQGFIPWDDDIDLMMTRKEYNRFRKVFKKELGNDYILAEPLCNKLYMSKMPKILKKGTKYTEITTAGIKAFHMLYIDLFIIENMPAPGIKRNINSFIYDLAFKGSSACCDFLFPSPPILKKQKSNIELWKYYTLRRIIGLIFTIFGGYWFYLKLLDNIASKYRETGWMGVPSALSYSKEIFNSELFTELSTGFFCGESVKIPADYDRYLTNLYGDYMLIPPKDKREVHIAYKIKI